MLGEPRVGPAEGVRAGEVARPVQRRRMAAFEYAVLKAAADRDEAGAVALLSDAVHQGLTTADRLVATIAALPLSIANTVRPDLELAGTIDGTARVTGSRERPDVAFNIRGDTLRAAALRQAGLSALNVTARGTTGGSRRLPASASRTGS